MNLIRKLFSPIVLFLSFFLLIYTYYRSEIYWNGSKSDYYQIYYFIFGFAILISICTFYLNDKFKDIIIIIFISVFFTIYSFELYITYYSNDLSLTKKSKIYKQNTGKEYDRRSVLEVYNELKKIDKTTSVIIQPIHYIKAYKDTELFPLSGISRSKTIYGNENGYHSIYYSDRYGFNNPDKEWDKKKIKYLLIGDSFIHGAAVNRPNDIASVIRTLSKDLDMENKSVINLGYAGNGPLINLATLKEYINPRVEKVLWFYTPSNDNLNLRKEFTSKRLKKYFYDKNFSQNLILKQKKIDQIATKILNKKKEKIQSFSLSKIIKIIKLNTLRTKFTRIENIPVDHKFKEIIDKVNDVVKSNNSKLYFLYLPNETIYFNKDFIDKDYSKVKKIVQDYDVSFINLYEVFENIEDPQRFFPFGMIGHYNVEGYRKIGEKVFELTK